MYDYLETIKEDVVDFVKNDIELKDFADRDELESYLNNELFSSDRVTGNASGSYTFSSYEAKENIEDNIDLLNEACNEFGTSAETVGDWFLSENWEAMDVTIRCYLLGQAIASGAAPGFDSPACFYPDAVFAFQTLTGWPCPVYNKDRILNACRL